MRNLFLLIVASTSVLMTIAQAPKKANLIIIKNVNEDSIINVLTTARYEIKNIIAHNIVTEFKSTGAVRVKLSIRIKDGNAYLSGIASDFGTAAFYGNKNVDEVASTIENVGMKGSPAKIAWNEMDRVAKLIGAEIEYVIEKI